MMSAFGKSAFISVVTEDAYPVQYLYKNEIMGPATELVHAVLETAEFDYDIQTYPWARAYERATTQKNTLIYSIARTPEREKQFKWVGSIIKLEYHMVGLNELDLPKPITLEALKKLKVGALRSSVTHKYLQSKGFKNIYLLSKPEQSINLLRSGRIDLFPISYSSFQLYCLKLRIDCQQLSSIFKLEKLSTSLYMAFSKSTDDKIVARAKAAYQKVMYQVDFTRSN
jgi:polar amino acid transport system substrate-binding protein